MRVAGRFRAVRKKDHAVPELLPRPQSPKGGALDIRVWTRGAGELPWLLVTASRKAGGAVERNRFRRRVRMVFLDLLRDPSTPDLRQAVVWVRPARGYRLSVPISYAELKGQLKLALSLWCRR